MIPKIQGANAEIFRSKLPEIGISGPAGCGKTFSILHKINSLCETYADLRILIVRKTREEMNDSVLETWETEVYPLELLERHPLERGSRKYYNYPNGSRVVVRGMDKPGKVLGSRWDIIYVNEATELTEKEFGQLASRLLRHVGPFNQIIYDCNPPSTGKLHWIWKRKERGATVLLFSDHKLNPTFNESDKQRLDSLPIDLKARFSDGSWDGVPEGGMWKVQWFKYLPAMPQGGKWMIGVDTGSSENPESDGTAISLIGFCTIDGRPAIVNGFQKFGHWNSGQRNAEMRLFYKRFEHLKPKLFFGRGFGDGVDKNIAIMDSLHGIPAYGLKERGNKVARADALVAQTYAGNYYLVEDKELPESEKWVVPYIMECCDFTGEEGKKDNRVDSCSIAYIMLSRTYPEVRKMLAAAGAMTEEEILKFRQAA